MVFVKMWQAEKRAKEDKANDDDSSSLGRRDALIAEGIREKGLILD